MKKILSLILIMALCFAILSSCGNTEITPTTGSTTGTQASTTATVPLAEIFGATLPAVKAPGGSGLTEYRSYVCALANSSYAPKMEIDFSNDKEGIAPPFSSIKVNFEGTEYNLSYTTSSRKTGNMYRKHTYSFSTLSLYMNEATQECVGFWFTPAEFAADDKLPDIENFEDEFLNMSDEYVSQFINTKDYERTYEIPKFNSLANTKIYKVIYTKYYNGIKTNDTVDIEITSKGKIKSLHINNVGAFDDITKEIDIDKVNQSVEDKVYTSCSREVLDCEISDQYLGFTPEGDLIVISHVNITISHNKEENIISKVGTILATPV